MSSAPATKAPPTKPKKDREKDRERKEKPPPVTERLKTVVRRLPPNLPEDVFWQSVDAWVSDETVTWKLYFPGKPRKRLGKENIPSRAYIAFKTEDQLALFGRGYDGHVFRDKAGNESQAVVEFAPYQKIPTGKGKPDARSATIEKDEDYISFLESLKSSSNAEPVSIETLIAASQPPAPPKTTPLLEALKAEKSANKDKEAILRNHAHYKDQTLASVGASRKEESKKKGAVAQKPAEPTPSGKKSHKKGAPVPASAGSKVPPIATTPKNVGTAPQAPPKSPKAVRTPKAPPQNKAIPTAPKAMIVGAASAPSVAEVTGPQSGQTAPAAATAPPRRTRPIIGLASRQFEAALSGAGVGASGERKSRREREKEREKESEKPPIGGTATAVPADVKQTPPSPRRDRGRGRGDSAVPAGPGPTVKIPSILQRIDKSPVAGAKDVPRIDNIDASASLGSDIPSSHHPGSGSRGARRGRGRGRGGHTGPVRGS